MDPTFHAFDADTGKEIWTVDLPAAAQSTPMTYEWQGKQYIVICAGASGDTSKPASRGHFKTGQLSASRTAIVLSYR